VYRRHPTLPFYTLAPHVERLIDTGETRWTVFTDEHGYRASERDAKATRPTDTARPVALVLGGCTVALLWMGTRLSVAQQKQLGHASASDRQVAHLSEKHLRQY
jgi:hypothetical protein